MTIEEKKDIVHQVYSPTQPIKEDDMFVGRQEHLEKIHTAVMESGQHIVLYGERGVGKTSLSNIVSNRYRRALAPAVTCNTTSSTQGIWRNLLSKLTLNIEYRKKVGFHVDPNKESVLQNIVTLADKLPNNGNASIDDITNLLLMLSETGVGVVFIFDEFDQVQDNEIINGMANIVKFCSDNVSNITIMLVGIGKSVTDLIGEHASIERCLKQIKLNKMSDEELSHIIENASSKIEVTMPESVKKKIVRYSSGFPHYTHLLGKYTTLSALDKGVSNIEEIDFTTAVKKALDNVSESIRNSYQKAIITTKIESNFPEVLIACALAPTDEHGTFRASDLEKVFTEKLGTDLKLQAYQYHIGKLCTIERGKILEKIEISSTQFRYRFNNPLFKGYLLLKHYNDKNNGS